MTAQGSSARELARHLLERETAGATEAAKLPAALQRAWTRVTESLRHAVGEDGYSALLARALARTESDQPMLKDICRAAAAGIRWDVGTAVESHGATAVGAAVESLFAALVDILSELIGVDMVGNLLDHDPSTQTPPRRRPR